MQTVARVAQTVSWHVWLRPFTVYYRFSYDVATVGDLGDVVYRAGRAALVDDQVSAAMTCGHGILRQYRSIEEPLRDIASTDAWVSASDIASAHGLWPSPF